MVVFGQGGYVQPLIGMGGPDDDIPSPGDPNSGIPLVKDGNPAWNNLVQYIPEDKRQEAMPILRQWDENFNKVQEEYASWKKLGVDPATAEMALNVYSALEHQPEMVYQALQKHLGFTEQQAKKAVEKMEEEASAPEFDITQHPEFQKLQQTADTLTKFVVTKYQEEQSMSEQQKQDQAVQKELDELKQKVGDYDEEQVIMRMLHKGLTAEKAFEDYQQWMDTALKNRRPAPFVLGKGGATPNRSIDPSKLSPQDRKKMAVQMLEFANIEGT